MNKKVDATGYTNQVNCVSYLICLTLLEEKDDIDQYNTLYVAGPWVAYKNAHEISKGTSSTRTKHKSPGTDTIPSPHVLVNQINK